ncbi:MAG TPA: toprim domain-containing protein, partial [Methanomicrobiales archaeon]|nr:toprim domain-containing protein [Methanomicrobiales archaeon]
EVRESTRVEKIVELGEDKVPAGPHVVDSDHIIIVEGRADVINLLKAGISNAVAVEGTKVPSLIIDLSKTKTTTVFVDGDRGGELILRALLQMADIDYVALCPKGKSVEEISRKELTKALRNRVPVEYLKEQTGEKTILERPVMPLPAVEVSSDRDVALSTPAPPHTLKGHMEDVENRTIARFLSPDFTILLESKADEVEKALETVNGNVAGVVIDRVVDQKLLDLFVTKGIEFLAAPDFRGIIKRPLSIKLLKIG